MRFWTLRKIVCSLFAVGIGSFLLYHFLALGLKGRPFCHKQIGMAFGIWMSDQGTKTFPNVGGRSDKSMLTISNEMNGSKWSDDYRYVPGLTSTDPGELVLLYVAEPTRWTWHGERLPSVFNAKAWIIVPLDFKMGTRDISLLGQGELSERVSEREFGERLRKTLEYLKVNERPNWQTLFAEHQELLERLEKTYGAKVPRTDPN